MPEKPNRKSFASHSAIYLTANLFSAAVPFLLLPVLTHYLTPAEYGHVAIFQALVAGLAAFTGLSVQAAANRKYYDISGEPQEMKAFISTCLQILLGSSIVTGLVLFLARAPLGTELGLDSKWLLGALLVALASFCVNLRLGQWQVRRQAFNYGLFQSLQALSALALTLIAVVILLEGAEGRIWALILTAVGFGLLATISLKRDGFLGLIWRPDYIREALSFGVPLVPHVCGIFVLSMADRFFINRELGPSATGIYTVAVQIALVLSILSDAINKAYVPWLFERLNRNNPLEQQQIVRYTYLYFLAALLLAGLMALLGPMVISLLAGGDYATAGNLLGWLALGQAFGGMYLMVTNYVFYAKKTGLLSLITLGSGAVNILLLIALIPLIGLSGAAVAFCLAMGLRFLLTWWLAQSSHPMPWLAFRNPT